jgi:hypothetical protein
MAFITVLRVSVVLLVAVLAVPAVPDAAQSLNKADAQDFQMFRNTISVRRNARLCERSVPATAKRLRTSTPRGLRSIAEKLPEASRSLSRL